LRGSDELGSRRNAARSGAALSFRARRAQARDRRRSLRRIRAARARECVQALGIATRSAAPRGHRRSETRRERARQSRIARGARGSERAMLMFALLFASVLCDVGGQVCFKIGVHDDERSARSGVAGFFLNLARSRWIAVGVVIYALEFVV